MATKLSREIRVERFLDGEWKDLGPLRSMSLDVPFKGYRRLKIVHLHDGFEIEVDPPWRMYVDGKILARTGWGGAVRFCKKAYG